MRRRRHIPRNTAPTNWPMKTNSRAPQGVVVARVRTDHDEYQRDVALPIETAIDNMPRGWRALVHEFDYVNVYLAWRRGLSPETVRQRAKANGGVFHAYPVNTHKR